MNRTKLQVFTAFWLMLSVGCVYGPKAERKTSLSYLNGESYETASDSGTDKLMVPLIKRKEKLTRIQGSVVSGEGISQIPVKRIPIGIYSQDGKLIQETSTDLDGRFSIAETLNNGRYLLKVTGDKYTGEEILEITSYEIGNVVVRAKSK